MFKIIFMLIFSVGWRASATPVSANSSNVIELFQQKAFTRESHQKSVPNYVQFYLYTRKISWGLQFNTSNTSWKQYFNESSETKILIHDAYHTEVNLRELQSAYLWHSGKYLNVLTVDYSLPGHENATSFSAVLQNVVFAVSKLLQNLKEYGATQIHIVGVGVGAHIGGAAAKSLPAKYSIERITGLDPIGVDFDRNESLPQICAESAKFVDIILTNTELFGTNKSRGHIVFYPNGGRVQPESDMFTSHLKAYYYFVESVIIPHRFQSYYACNWQTFLKNETSKIDFMGEYVSRNKTGTFYLRLDDITDVDLVKAPLTPNEITLGCMAAYSFLHELFSPQSPPMEIQNPFIVPRHQLSGPCKKNNGGCHQICTNRGNDVECSCYEHFELEDNGRGCKKGRCNYKIMADYGDITSPNYPLNYPDSIYCTYHIITTPGKHIRLSFTDVHVENCYDCRCDTISVYDGNSTKSTFINSYCGNQYGSLVSTTNHLFVTFTTNVDGNLKGFLLSFSSEFD